jgi:hypothetical protein
MEHLTSLALRIKASSLPQLQFPQMPYITRTPPCPREVTVGRLDRMIKMNIRGR